MAIPSDEKPRPQRRTQEQERVLIFVGSGFALRAAANLLRAVRRLSLLSFCSRGAYAAFSLRR